MPIRVKAEVVARGTATYSGAGVRHHLASGR